jgi:hypothetical protein
MINKKNLLGKTPHELGTKDAIHTAIVAVRAAQLIKPGQRCGLNEFNEAIPSDKGPGVADPFLRAKITTGQVFWLLLGLDEVPNVRHVWEHPTVKFDLPTRETQRNRTIESYAKTLGVTYEQLMDAAEKWAIEMVRVDYPGALSEKDLDRAFDEEFDRYDFWSEWSAVTGHEFENQGSACCPEYAYPDGDLFVWVQGGAA